ncbi:MAG: hypothetical protein OXU98_06510 [Gammaproteobacteria bacterium]|nr:hypothetical protein [Gammaproteobacteria bacterium]
MILAHPNSCTSPAAVARVEQATGRRAVIRGGRVELRAAASADEAVAAARAKVAVVDTRAWAAGGAMDGPEAA